VPLIGFAVAMVKPAALLASIYSSAALFIVLSGHPGHLAGNKKPASQ
jgi:hypothetical protein